MSQQTFLEAGFSYRNRFIYQNKYRTKMLESSIYVNQCILLFQSLCYTTHKCVFENDWIEGTATSTFTMGVRRISFLRFQARASSIFDKNRGYLSTATALLPPSPVSIHDIYIYTMLMRLCWIKNFSCTLADTIWSSSGNYFNSIK